MLEKLDFAGNIRLLNKVMILPVTRFSTHLFVKVPRPENSEVTFSVFESRCHLLLPV